MPNNLPDLLEQRGLPASPDVERMLLGGLLIDAESFAAVQQLIGRDAFSVHSHAFIWDAMVNLHESGRTIDRMMLCEELSRAGRLNQVGGIEKVAYLDEGMPSLHAGTLEDYARTVAAKALRRRAIQACQITQDALLTGEDTPDTLDSAQRTLARLAEESQRGGEIPSVGQAIEAIGIEQLMAPRQKARGSVPLPWPRLASIIPCLMPEQLILWAARPGHGKSVVGCQVACHAARAGVPVAVFSLEMGRAGLIKRMACQEAGIDSYWIDTGLIRKPAYRDQLTALNEALGRLAGLPIYIEDQFVTTVAAMTAKLRNLRAQHGLGLVIVDYLQLLECTGRAESANQRISQISRSLKLLSKELQVPVVALSQLTRANDKEKRPPQLSDLRDSGSLEQDADVVVFNHIEKLDFKLPTVEIDIVVAKQREGAVFKVRMSFERTFTRIVDKGEE